MDDLLTDDEPDAGDSGASSVGTPPGGDYIHDDGLPGARIQFEFSRDGRLNQGQRA